MLVLFPTKTPPVKLTMVFATTICFEPSCKPVIHIGILDYTLFENAPEFYATYELQNIRTQQTYSRKLSLNMLDLTQIDRATEEDKCFGIDRWAALFRATTWEELRMITKKRIHE